MFSKARINSLRLPVVLSSAIMLLGSSALANSVFTENFNFLTPGSAYPFFSDTDKYSQMGVGDYYFLGSGQPAGWTKDIPNVYAWSATSSPTNYGILLNEPTGKLSRVIPGLVANTTYDLIFKYWGDNRPTQYSFNVTMNNITTAFTGTSVTYATALAGPGTFNTATISFLYLGTNPGDSTLTFDETTSGGSEASPIIDDISISVTPEPGFYGVLCLGISGLFFVRRRAVKS